AIDELHDLVFPQADGEAGREGRRQQVQQRLRPGWSAAFPILIQRLHCLRDLVDVLEENLVPIVAAIPATEDFGKLLHVAAGTNGDPRSLPDALQQVWMTTAEKIGDLLRPKDAARAAIKIICSEPPASPTDCAAAIEKARTAIVADALRICQDLRSGKQ